MAEIPTINPDWKSAGRTSNTSYYMAGDDALIVLPDTGLKDNAASARENTAFQLDVAKRLGRPLGLVVYLTSLLGQDAEARKVYAALDKEMFSGSALVVSNPLARAIGSFFLGLSRPAFPAKLVGTIEEGIAWISTLPQHANGK
jgi:hypothetical protein